MTISAQRAIDDAMAQLDAARAGLMRAKIALALGTAYDDVVTKVARIHGEVGTEDVREPMERDADEYARENQYLNNIADRDLTLNTPIDQDEYDCWLADDLAMAEEQYLYDIEVEIEIANEMALRDHSAHLLARSVDLPPTASPRQHRSVSACERAEPLPTFRAWLVQVHPQDPVCGWVRDPNFPWDESVDKMVDYIGPPRDFWAQEFADAAGQYRAFWRQRAHSRLQQLIGEGDPRMLALEAARIVDDKFADRLLGELLHVAGAAGGEESAAPNDDAAVQLSP
ncbi:MAG: hypothetical protein NT062_38705 [Proteobacteria bacterium]|nr:hypothetical protein [Pseudomonadota bacterium]